MQQVCITEITLSEGWSGVLFVSPCCVSAFAVEGRPDKTKPIKCYQCNSFYDKGCSDFFDNRTYPLIPCSSNATMCRKIIQEGKCYCYLYWTEVSHDVHSYCAFL